MSFADHVANAPGIWRSAHPADKEAIAALRAAAPIELPVTYLEMLAVTNGGEGDLGIKPGWFAPWPAEDVIRLNAGYQVADNLPKLFGFGSNGGGELIAFDTRDSQPWPIVMVPFVPMEMTEAVLIARDFDEFSNAIGVPEDDHE